MKDDLTIGEFAKFMEVSINQIRYFERKGILRPKYTTDSGYRMYGNNEVHVLSRILLLRKLHISVAEIKSIFDSDNQEYCIDLLKETVGNIELEIRKLTNTLNKAKRVINSVASQEDYLDIPIIKELESRVYYEYAQTDDNGLETSAREMYKIWQGHKGNLPSLDEDFIVLHTDITNHLCSNTGYKGLPEHHIPQGKYLCYATVTEFEDYDELIDNVYSYAIKNSLTLDGPLIMVSDSLLSILNRNSEYVELQIRVV